MIRYIRIKILELFLAGVIFIMIVGIAPTWYDVWIKNANPDDYLEIQKLIIPDFNSGTNPNIIYNRIIHESFFGEWSTEILQIHEDNYFAVCRGFGSSNYSPMKILPTPVTLEWYVGKNCNLLPGKYRLETVWIIHLSNNIEIRQTTISNIFEVK